MKPAISVTIGALKASYVVLYLIAKVKKPFDIWEQLILPAAKDICQLLFGDAAESKE